MDLPDNLFTLNPEVPWRIDQGFNTCIDFCIWVLEIDGLHVPPFDQHPEGNRILQDKGLNADSWQQWLATVVILQEPILLQYKYFPEPSLLIEEQLNGINWMYSELTQHPEWSNQQIDLPAIRSSLLKQFSSLERQYQSAIAQVSHISGNPLDYIERPFDVFPGSPEVREILVSLWQRYQEICEKERVDTPNQRGGGRVLGNGDKNELWGLEYLNIHKVRYPIAVEYYIPPASVIVSLANDLASSGEFYALVERAARRFVQTND